jgi:hypothetical protein
LRGLVCACVALVFAAPASAQEYKLTVTTNAGGSVTGGSLQKPSSINCGPNSTGDCEDTYPPGIETVQLTATPLSGWAFGSWSGNCSAATTNLCNITFFTNANRTAGATFEDVTSPTVALVDPAENSIVRGTYFLRATATDEQTGVERVEFWIDGVLLATRTTPNSEGQYVAGWTTASDNDGNHFLHIRAYDNAGRQGVDSATVKSDNTSPFVTVSDPPDGATVRGIVPIRAIAGDDIAGVSRVDFFAVQPAPIFGATCPPGTASYQTANMALRAFAGHSPSGMWLLEIDNDVSSESADVTLSAWSLEFGPPYVRFTSSDVPVTVFVGGDLSSYLTIPPGMGPAASVRVVDVELMHDATAEYVVRLYTPDGRRNLLFSSVPCETPWTAANTGFTLDDGILLGSDSTPPYIFDWNSATFPDGSWGIGLRAFDNVGNERNVAQSVLVNVDNSAPAGGSGGPALPPGCTIGGTDGPDTIMGTPGNDVICAGKGNDIVRGGGGNDVILLGAGNDRGYGQGGNDRIVGQQGRDRLFGGGGNDTLLAKDRVKKELVDGGPGKKDVCKMDRGDIKRRCP